MSTPTRLALIGAGAIAITHLESATPATQTQFVAVVDPRPETQKLAQHYNIKWFSCYEKMLQSIQPDGVVIAVPNALHEPIASAALEQGVAVLLEKPIANTVEEGLKLAQLSAQKRTPLLVAHHRRHNPIIRTVRHLIQQQRLGQVIGVNSLVAFYKPDAYFTQSWRTTKGGGPVLINLIHEIDLLRFVLGEIAEIHAITSHAARHLEVEDSAAVTLRFENNCLATLLLSDRAASPWSWDLTANENPYLFPHVSQNSHYFIGTQASLALPSLSLWHYPNTPSWSEEIMRETIQPLPQTLSAYEEQLRHFGAVIRGEETPIIDALDATRTLAATLHVTNPDQNYRIEIS